MATWFVLIVSCPRHINETKITWLLASIHLLYCTVLYTGETWQPLWRELSVFDTANHNDLQCLCFSCQVLLLLLWSVVFCSWGQWNFNGHWIFGSLPNFDQFGQLSHFIHQLTKSWVRIQMIDRLHFQNRWGGKVGYFDFILSWHYLNTAYMDIFYI